MNDKGGLDLKTFGGEKMPSLEINLDLFF